MSEQVYTYQTIAVESEGRFQSRGSKFIAYAFPMSELADLENRIAELKSEHPKARHHCYGYRVLTENGIREYSSDDGEPSGSAGKPILAALKSAELLNAGCVVVRYFGGTKLGVPGLIEAYKESTKDALSQADDVTVTRTKVYRLQTPMRIQPHILNACKKLGVVASNFEYGAYFKLDVQIPLQDEAQTILSLFKLLSGRDYTDIQDYLDFLEIGILNQDPTLTQ